MRYPITFNKVIIALHSKIVKVLFDIVHCVKVKKKLQKHLFIMIYPNITFVFYSTLSFISGLLLFCLLIICQVLSVSMRFLHKELISPFYMALDKSFVIFWQH